MNVAAGHPSHRVMRIATLIPVANRAVNTRRNFLLAEALVPALNVQSLEESIHIEVAFLGPTLIA
jgi:hypothetical protein